LFIRVWQKFCHLVVKIFYRHYEVSGLEHIHESGPVLLCANHANALADAVILQAVMHRHIHPMARSGLFKNPVLWPILKLIKAIPVYRRQDPDSNMVQNQDSFRKCYELFDENGVLLIFPEGQSHSDPSLRPLKTGAARIALGAIQANSKVPLLVPAGLNFSSKGRFRSTVFIKFGEPVDLQPILTKDKSIQSNALTEAIYKGLDDVTLNVDSNEELDFIRSLERFFALRHGKYRQRSLELKFRALKKLALAGKQLRDIYPEKMQAIRRRLHNFERLCRALDIKDYHLTFDYRPSIIFRFIMRSLFILLVILPLGVWGILNSFVPFFLTRWTARSVSRGEDQYDTAKMVIGLVLFILFWGIQTGLVAKYYSYELAMYYLIFLIPTSAAALMLRNERRRIWDNIRVFFLFVRRRRLRLYLEARRHELEKDLAQLVRLIKKKRRIS